MDVRALFDRPTDPARLPGEQRLLLAALECIEASGLEGTTVRAIAARAGMNIAAANYYFRSKDRLVESALRLAWRHFADDVAGIRASTPEESAALQATARFVLEGAYRYPRIIRAIVVDHPTLRREAAADFATLFDPGARAEAPLGTALLLAFAVFIGAAPQAAELLAGADLGDAAARGRLWDLVARRCFPNVPPGGSSSP